MFRIIPDVLTRRVRTQLDALARAATTEASAQTVHGDPNAKRCRTVPYDSPEGREAAELVAGCLRSSQQFLATALPTFTTTPRLVAYDTGHGYPVHIDEPFMTDRNIRTDLAATLYVSGSDDYAGGSLRVHLGDVPVDLHAPAGSMVLYPAHFRHEVTEVTEGRRVVVLLWVQSSIADGECRSLLADLADAEAQIESGAGHSAAASIAAVRSALLRRWHTSSGSLVPSA